MGPITSLLAMRGVDLFRTTLSGHIKMIRLERLATAVA
jgi:hypothetical protein